MSRLESIFKRVKASCKELAELHDEERNAVLREVARAIISHQEELLTANAIDLSQMDSQHPLYDRLLLTPQRLEEIASGILHVASLPSPLGKILKEEKLNNGLRLQRISVPYGVIGMIYEARPNVTYDVFSLCFKSGNAAILKGGKDADHSNRAAVKLIHEVLVKHNIDPNVVALLPATHDATREMLNAVGYIDLCIPRGGKELIKFVRNTAKVPVIETGAGVVHAYFDKDGDIQIGPAIIHNAKTRRPSVCNALDTLLINRDRLEDLDILCKPLAEHHVWLYADREAYSALNGRYPASLLYPSQERTFDTEWMDYKMGIRTVQDVDEAIAHIAVHGSGHSECIITDNRMAALKFQQAVDAACVYVNTPTSFTDGAQFGLGAEIGISTQKLGPRGPMGLEEITTYKWLIRGHGQVRP